MKILAIQKISNSMEFLFDGREVSVGREKVTFSLGAVNETGLEEEKTFILNHFWGGEACKWWRSNLFKVPLKNVLL